MVATTDADAAIMDLEQGDVAIAAHSDIPGADDSDTGALGLDLADPVYFDVLVALVALSV